ncbi:hypothetical protein LJY25_20485 [Hymenobacter sp. BT175]|uniref:hypothetical protein n=1 Tax=Hymenobacter translucens TaxID=2886507 RepID=UPI001D0DE7EB|nr:hypothetical protein [Hymenobacter translucens]MCC2548838.1 hypothetical protein [Hymenobacter translucens]
MKNLLSLIALLGLLAGCRTSGPGRSTAIAYPPAAGFDLTGSDPRAVAVADTVMLRMGGYPAWEKARVFAWSFFGGQYQVWDKYTGDFHWEKDTLVANYNLNSREGKVYSRGQDISATPAGKKVLDRMYPIWINNSYWLLMPFKLKDSGVTLGYKGLGQTQAGAPAHVLQLTFKNVGVTPDNRYEVLVGRKSGLVEEWAYFDKATNTEPAFRSKWGDYQPHGTLLLAADRSRASRAARLDDIAVLDAPPAGVMTSTTPVNRLK